MRPELFIQYVQPAELSTSDWELLLAADQAGPQFYSISPTQLAGWLASREMHLLRVRPNVGLLLLEVRTGPAGLKRLGIVRAACRPPHSLGWVYKHCSALLQHTAREWGCQQIESMVYDSRVAAALERIGARAEATNMVLEVEDG